MAWEHRAYQNCPLCPDLSVQDLDLSYDRIRLSIRPYHYGRNCGLGLAFNTDSMIHANWCSQATTTYHGSIRDMPVI